MGEGVKTPSPIIIWKKPYNQPKLFIAQYIVYITTFRNFGQYLNSLNC